MTVVVCAPQHARRHTISLRIRPGKSICFDRFNRPFVSYAPALHAVRRSALSECLSGTRDLPPGSGCCPCEPGSLHWMSDVHGGLSLSGKIVQLEFQCKVSTASGKTYSGISGPQRLGTVGKCTFCVGNQNHGLLSECASGCPMGTLYNGDLKTDVAVSSMGNTVKLSKFLYDNDVVTFKSTENTHPRVWYILGHGQNLDSDMAAKTK